MRAPAATTTTKGLRVVVAEEREVAEDLVEAEVAEHPRSTPLPPLPSALDRRAFLDRFAIRINCR